MGTIRLVIFPLILVFLYPANASRIFQLTTKVQLFLRSNSLDELLGKSTMSSVVYFTQADTEDRRDGIDLISPILVALTDLPRLLDIFHINCNRTVNRKDCSNYGFQKPGLRFFPNGFNRTEVPDDEVKGLEIAKKSLYEMREAVLNALTRVELKLPGQPNFKPILHTDTPASLFRQAASKDITHIVLVGLPKKGSLLGRNTILNLLKWKQVMVRIVDNPTIFRKFGIHFKAKDKMLIIIPRSRRILQLSARYPFGREYAKSVINFIMG